MNKALPLTQEAAGLRAPVALSRWAFITGLVVFGSLWAAGVGGLLDNNEAMYAEIAREMVRSGDWVVPHLNGLPYLEKPPMLYWSVALAIRAFGTSELAIRSVPALFLLGTVFAVVRLGWRIGGADLGFRAGVILASATGFILSHRTLLADIPLTCFVAWSLANGWEWLHRGRRSALWSFYGFMGLAVLSKGLVGIVLTGATILAVIAWERRGWSQLFRLFDPVALGIFAAVALPWHLWAAAREPGFFNYYIINEQLLRFLNRRFPHDYYNGPFYYYLPRLPAYLGVWTAFLPLLMRKHAASIASTVPGWRSFLWAWALVTLVFFSASNAKANYYLMPAIPGFALLLATVWPRAPLHRDRWLLAGSGLVCAVFVSVPFVWLATPSPTGLSHTTGDSTFATLVLVAVVSVVQLCLALQHRPARVLVMIALLQATLLLPAPQLLRDFEEHTSQREIARLINATNPNAPVFLLHEFEKFSSVPFYLGREVRLVDSRSCDLLYGERRRERPELFLSRSAFAHLSRSRRVWLLVDAGEIAKDRRWLSSLGLHTVRATPKLVLLAN